MINQPATHGTYAAIITTGIVRAGRLGYLKSVTMNIGSPVGVHKWIGGA
jgi:hypothetical protein